MASLRGLLLGLALLLVQPGASLGQDELLAPAQDIVRLNAVIAEQRPAFTPPQGVTGITVPHHLLAADLIARGFWAASAGDYDRIILLAPDHFRAVKGAFATTYEDLSTVFGAVQSDDASIARLLAAPEIFERLDTVADEHGLMAVAPFIAQFFPDAVVVPVLGSINATEADWRAAADALAPLLDGRTLIVQSTDFSHYRPLSEAIARDQETLAAIAAGDPLAIDALLQPSHLDSKASQFIQTALQSEVFRAHPVVVANRNSAEYGSNLQSTTSYVVTVFVADPAAGSVFDYPDQTRVFFAGDVLLGRFMLPALRDATSWNAIADTVLAQTQGAPLIVNLEGVLLNEAVTGVDFGAHVMVTEIAAPILTELNVAAAGLANNHANDLGETGLAESIRLLADIGITPLQHGRLNDLGAFRLIALNFLHGKFAGDLVAEPHALEFICGLAADPPLIAFVHWGGEYTARPGAKEQEIAERLVECGVSLIVGAHSHQASAAIQPLSGGTGQLVFSLGNFLFDQSAPRGSGALMELRIFQQGTFATRLLPIANLFDLGRSVLETNERLDTQG